MVVALTDHRRWWPRCHRMVTAVAPVKLVPVMVTLVPPAIGPEFGVTLVTVGGGAASTCVKVAADSPQTIATHQIICLRARPADQSTNFTVSPRRDPLVQIPTEAPSRSAKLLRNRLLPTVIGGRSSIVSGQIGHLAVCATQSEGDSVTTPGSLDSDCMKVYARNKIICSVVGGKSQLTVPQPSPKGQRESDIWRFASGEAPKRPPDALVIDTLSQPAAKRHNTIPPRPIRGVERGNATALARCGDRIDQAPSAKSCNRCRVVAHFPQSGLSQSPSRRLKRA